VGALGGAAVLIILILSYLVVQEHRTAQAERKKAEQAIVEQAARDAAKPKEIRGQMYMSLVGGGAVKLAGVQVLVVTAEEAMKIKSLEGVQCQTALTNLKYWVARKAELSQKVFNERMIERSFAESLNGIALPKWVQEKTAVEAKLDRLKPLLKESEQIDDQINRWNTPQILLPDRWRNNVCSATTDADGWFTVQVPKQGCFYATALAERAEGSSVQHYGWLVPLAANSENQVFLNNNNRLPLPTDLGALLPAN
jgi:hypothetical protein